MTTTAAAEATNERTLLLSETEIPKVPPTAITKIVGKAKEYNNTQTIFGVIEDGSNTTILMTIITVIREVPTTIILVLDGEEARLPHEVVTLLTQSTIAMGRRYHICTSITHRLRT